MEKITTCKEIGRTGSSLVLYLTKEVKALNLSAGSMVKVTIEKIQ